MTNTTIVKSDLESSEFTGLLRVVRVNNLGSGLFKASCTLVDEAGEIVDLNGLYFIESSHVTMGRFVEVGQLWWIEYGICLKDNLITESGYPRPAYIIEPYKMEMRRPSGKHLLWHFTNGSWYSGIGTRKAESLIETLSDENGHDPLYRALDDSDTSALAKAPLITAGDADTLADGWKKHGSTDTLKWFEEKQIDVGLAKKVFEYHGAKTIEVIESDPYCLTSFNMPWRKVDELAQCVFNVGREDERRLQAAVTEALWEAFNDDGHTKVELCQFLDAMQRYLGGDLELWIKAHINMIDQSRAIVREPYVHTFEPAVMEMMVANRIADLLSQEYLAPLSTKQIRTIIKEFECTHALNLTKDQKAAIATSVSNPFSIITGGAGVGKTTVLKALYALYDAAGFQRIQLALAGRAAQRMTEATGEDATTIAGHLFHFDWGEINEGRLPKTVVVIDEASMVDIHSMYRLVNKIPASVHLILIGDPFQLPPVGAGLVLHELVERAYLPVSHLSVVKRQGKDSSIPLVADDVRHGRVPAELGKNVEFHDINSNDLVDRAIDEYSKDPEYSQILCATNALVKRVNAKAQVRLNPSGVELQYVIEGLCYNSGIRRNDPVICTSNIYREEFDLRNGTMGKIIDIYDKPRIFEVRKSRISKKMTQLVTYGRVKWDDESKEGYVTELPMEVIENLQLAYGITVHKAQGSQFNHAIFAVVDSENLDRTLVYTAITRARQYAIVLGDISAVNRAIVNPPSAAKRQVGFGQFLGEILSAST